MIKKKMKRVVRAIDGQSSSSVRVLRGLLQRDLLGTFIVIRGYADLRHLARLSVPFVMRASGEAGIVEGHQRAISQAHVEGIRRYIENGTARFLPEIVLSLRLSESDYASVKESVDGERSVEGLVKLSLSAPFAHGVLATTTVRDSDIKQVRSDRLIRRLDGNHRLTAAESLPSDAPQPANKYRASFCLVVLGPAGDPAADNAEARIFHAVNSTAMPLDTEHALQLLLDQPESQQQQADVEFAYDPILYLCRQWRKRIQDLGEEQAKFFGTSILASLQTTARALRAVHPERFDTRAKCDKLAKDSFSALTHILPTLPTEPQGLLSMSCAIEAAALAWSDALAGDGDTAAKKAAARLGDVNSWVTRHSLTSLNPQGSLARQLLDVHDNIRRAVPRRVFLARWYPRSGDDGDKANRRLEQIRIALEQVKSKTGVELALIDMGTEEGGTVMIHPKMYEAIESADIILVDLTGHRPNVCVEAGYALKHHKAGRLLFTFEPKDKDDKVAFDLNTYRYEPLSQAADIPVKLVPHLVKIVEDAKAGKLPASAKS